MYSRAEGPMFTDILDMIRYFHSNISSGLSLKIMDFSEGEHIFLAAYDHENQSYNKICLIEENDLYDAIALLRSLNKRHETN